MRFHSKWKSWFNTKNQNFVNRRRKISENELRSFNNFSKILICSWCNWEENAFSLRWKFSCDWLLNSFLIDFLNLTISSVMIITFSTFWREIWNFRAIEQLDPHFLFLNFWIIRRLPTKFNFSIIWTALTENLTRLMSFVVRLRKLDQKFSKFKFLLFYF